MQAAQKVQADLAHQAEAVKKDLLEMEQREAQLASVSYTIHNDVYEYFVLLLGETQLGS